MACYVAIGPTMPSSLAKPPSLSLPVAVLIHGLLQHLEEIGDGGGHAVPIGNQGNAERVAEIFIGGETERVCERADRQHFLMAVEGQTVDRGVVLVLFYRILGHAQIANGQRLEERV